MPLLRKTYLKRKKPLKSRFEYSRHKVTKKKDRRGATATLTYWRDKFDEVFSIYIRMRDAVEDRNRGLVKCRTCSTVNFWKLLQNGHYVSRAVMSLRFSEVNCHSQCPRCNIWLKGNLTEYAIFLTRKYGKEVLEQLHREKQRIQKYTIPEYQRLIDNYKTKILELESKL